MNVVREDHDQVTAVLGVRREADPWRTSGTNRSFTRRAASAESVTPSYRRTAAYIPELVTTF
ncbi:hypothetical protein OHS71_34330 [Streptomyces sp. NBC_00377]|uniref:hypothetical protein n=1 Tax=unclassified Streptomyces TaxID=2593676 RepID=UPI002E1A1B37|nr:MULTISPECIES: hypothetical protein [unclassified Streptomyces]